MHSHQVISQDTADCVLHEKCLSFRKLDQVKASKSTWLHLGTKNYKDFVVLVQIFPFPILIFHINFMIYIFNAKQSFISITS